MSCQASRAMPQVSRRRAHSLERRVVGARRRLRIQPQRRLAVEVDAVLQHRQRDLRQRMRSVRVDDLARTHDRTALRRRRRPHRRSRRCLRSAAGFAGRSQTTPSGCRLTRSASPAQRPPESIPRSSAPSRRAAAPARSAASTAAGPVMILFTSGRDDDGGSTVSVGGSPSFAPGVDRHDHPVLGEIQRSEQRPERVPEVIPRPRQPWPRILERVVVADDAPVDAPDAEHLERRRPTRRGRRLRVRRSTDRPSRR